MAPSDKVGIPHPHFAFNELVLETDNVHRLPFVLDAVFKEDIESQNRDLIYKFICISKPKDTQTIFSVAFATNQSSDIQDMAAQLGGNVNLITIGDLQYERSLLYYSNEKYEDLIQETNDLIVNVN